MLIKSKEQLNYNYLFEDGGKLKDLKVTKPHCVGHLNGRQTSESFTNHALKTFNYWNNH